jgi:predicted nicotinamide N-methyase
MYHAAYLQMLRRKQASEANILPGPTEPLRDVPPFADTPVESLGPMIRELVILPGLTLTITRPEATDHLIDIQAVRARFAIDEYLPYWTDLWPAARMLAKVVLKEPWPAGAKVLEIGCGLGLPGLAALARGLSVIFSDCDMTALQFAGENARANGFRDFELLPLDWRSPPSDLRVPFVLASDLTFELRHVEPLVGLLKQVLLPGGLCLLTDQDRPHSQALRTELTNAGFSLTTKRVRTGVPDGRRFQGTLYRIVAPG